MTPPTPSTTLAQAIRDIQPIGSQLVNAASRLAYMHELLPQRGELTDEFKELVTTLAWIERAYRDADERLVQAWRLLEHTERVPSPLPLRDTA